MNNKTILIGVGIAGVLFLCLCMAVGGFIAYRTISQTNEIISNIEPTEMFGEVVATMEALPEILPTEVIELPENETEVQSTLDQDGARTAAGNFVLALSNHEYDSAREMTDASMRDSTDTTAQLQDLVENQGFEPQIWEWLTVEVNDNIADLTGVINFADGRRGKVEVQTTEENGQWVVNYINFTTDGESIDPGALSTWDDQRTNEELTFATATADYFIIDWADQDYENAYLLCASIFKDQVREQDELEEILTGLGVTPATWTWDSHSFIEVDGEERPVIELVGTVDYEAGKNGPITIQLMWEDGFWNVRFFDIKAE